MFEDLIEVINETDSFTNKIKINHFDRDNFTAQDNHSDNHKDDSQTWCNDMDNFEDQSNDDLDSSQQLDGMELNTMVQQENRILLTMESSKSMSISVTKHTGITSTSMFIKVFFYSIYIKASLLLCLYNNLYQCLYRMLFYVISIETSIR